MTNKIMCAICDVNISKYCRGIYNIGAAAYYANLQRNNGIFRCKMCAIDETHKGSKSHYFKYNKNENYFEIIDDDTKAYLLGALAGDGSLTHKTIILVANSKDVETINLMVDKIYLNGAPKLGKIGNCFSINITSEKLATDVLTHLKLSPGKKSDKITLPDLPAPLLWAFIRGLFDTDGCVSNIMAKETSPQCFCSSTSIKILEQIKNICNEENIIGNITGIKLKFSGRHALAFMRKIYENSTTHLSRKYEMFKLWETWVPRKGHVYFHPDTRSKRRKLKDGDVRYILKNTENLSRSDLAKKFNTTNATISDILNNKIYKEIKNE